MLPSHMPPHDQYHSFRGSTNHVKLGDDSNVSAQNVLLRIILADETEGEERDEK